MVRMTEIEFIRAFEVSQLETLSSILASITPSDAGVVSSEWLNRIRGEVSEMKAEAWAVINDEMVVG
ncbi:hypothetical protein N9X87_00030 [bacterium]|nr:hypothetical protein [bacterium]